LIWGQYHHLITM